MHRTQIYLTEVQRQRLAKRAADAGISQADLIRRMLDRKLGLLREVEDPVSIVKATAGVMADYPDWPEWLTIVRGEGGDARLRELGM